MADDADCTPSTWKSHLPSNHTTLSTLALNLSGLSGKQKGAQHPENLALVPSRRSTSQSSPSSTQVSKASLPFRCADSQAVCGGCLTLQSSTFAQQLFEQQQSKFLASRPIAPVSLARLRQAPGRVPSLGIVLIRRYRCQRLISKPTATAAGLVNVIGMDPLEAEIAQIAEVASLNPQSDRSMIVRALKEFGGNVESVVMQYYDDSEKFRRVYSGWDDAMFSADRDSSEYKTPEYQTSNYQISDEQEGLSFHIESVDDAIKGVLPSEDQSTACAPSRPPSRSGKDQASEKIDWHPGMEVTTGDSAPYTQEEKDMQRALRESAQEAGIIMPKPSLSPNSPQVSSVAPSTDSNHDQNNWVMVRRKSEIVNAPPPHMRRRLRDAPAFLVQGFMTTTREHCLGGLITIFHEIPLARNLLLRSGFSASSYGFNSDWWNGREILDSRTKEGLQVGTIEWGSSVEIAPVYEHEIHRLMAFLDLTERSYGTVSVLTDILPYTGISPEKVLFERILRTQSVDGLMKPITHVAALDPISGDDPNEEEASFGLLEIEPVWGNYDDIKTLYESLDQVMWSDALRSCGVVPGSRMAMFKDMGEVLTLKFTGLGPEESVEIPVEFYPERYLISRKDEARRIQRGLMEARKALIANKRRRELFKSWKGDTTGVTGLNQDVCRKVRDRCEVYRKYLEGRSQFRVMEESGFDSDKYPVYRAAPCQANEEEKEQERAVEEMRLIIEQLTDVDENLQALDQELDAIRSKMRFLGRLLTDPGKTDRPKPMTCNKYLLRGIATPIDLMFVCRQKAEPKVTERHDQWWKLAYAPYLNPPVITEKITVEDALSEVWTITSTPLLVYATEEALEEWEDALPAELTAFARTENNNFVTEFRMKTTAAANTHSERKPNSQAASVLKPESQAVSIPKQMHRAGSVDSMDSTWASLGSEQDDAMFQKLVTSAVSISELELDEDILGEQEEVPQRTSCVHNLALPT